MGCAALKNLNSRHVAQDDAFEASDEEDEMGRPLADAKELAGMKVLHPTTPDVQRGSRVRLAHMPIAFACNCVGTCPTAVLIGSPT